MGFQVKMLYDGGRSGGTAEDARARQRPRNDVIVTDKMYHFWAEKLDVGHCRWPR